MTTMTEPTALKTYRCFLDHLPGDVEYVVAPGAEAAARLYAERRWLSWSVRGPDIVVSMQCISQGAPAPIHRFRVACVVRPVAVSCQAEKNRMIVASPGKDPEEIALTNTSLDLHRLRAIVGGPPDLVCWEGLDVYVNENALWDGAIKNPLPYADMVRLLLSSTVVFSRSDENMSQLPLTDEDVERIWKLIASMPAPRVPSPRAEA